MIDDIVILPRRLKQFKYNAHVSSEQVCCPPISNIDRLVGYESPNDDVFIEAGTHLSLPTGVDTWFRCKLIENTRNGIVEYFCISQSPLDIFRIKRSSKTLLYCLWVSIIDPVTFKRRKYVLWEHVRALMRYEIEDNVSDVPIEAVIADEIRAFADMNDSHELLMSVINYPDAKEINRISQIRHDIDGLGIYLTLCSNIRALNEIYSLDQSIHAPFPIDVLRGIDLPERWSDLSPLRKSSVLKHLLVGPATIRELLFLFDPKFGLHCFQRGFNDALLPDDTEIDIPKEDDHEVFSIIEYIETIPYGEFDLTVDVITGKHEFIRRNPFDMNELSRNLHCDRVLNDFEPEVQKAIDSIREDMPDDVISVHVARSWAEEAYITFRYADGKTRSFYVDIAIHALCSRSLIRDYQIPMFTMS